MGTRRSKHNKGRKPIYKEFRRHLDVPDATPDQLDDLLDSTFLFSENAKTLTVERAQSLNEGDSYPAFLAIRWPGARPTCPACGGDKVYWLQSHPRWRCAGCGTYFTATSSTVFASHKLPFRMMMIALAVTVGATPTASVSEASRQIGITSKAGQMLVRRLREAARLVPLPEHVQAVPAFEIGRPRYSGGLAMSTRCWWTAPEKTALACFVEGRHTPEQSGVALGRSPTSIARYARDMGIKLPPDWSKLVAPKKLVLPRHDLCYPYIIKPRAEHADLLALNELVPHSYPAHMRADICQEMMLAVLEGRTTIDEIKSNQEKSAWFLKKFWMANHEQSGHAVSFSNVDDERTYDEIAASGAAKQWYREQFSERTRFVDTARFQPPTQIEDTYASQIRREQRRLDTLGNNFSFDEVEAGLNR